MPGFIISPVFRENQLKRSTYDGIVHFADLMVSLLGLADQNDQFITDQLDKKGNAKQKRSLLGKESLLLSAIQMSKVSMGQEPNYNDTDSVSEMSIDIRKNHTQTSFIKFLRGFKNLRLFKLNE